MSSDTDIGSDMQIELQVNHYQQLAKQVQDRGRADATWLVATCNCDRETRLI